MLRINLLPIRQLKKRAKAVNQIVSALIALCCVLFFLLCVGYYQKSSIAQTQTRIDDLDRQKKNLQKTLNLIDKYQKNTEELHRRIDVINNLRQDSSLTVHILDELTSLVDNERIWLNSLSQNGTSLNLEGVALDNESIAQFMDALKQNDYFRSVNLGQSTHKSYSGRNLKSFNLTCSVQRPEVKEEDNNKK